MKITEDKLNRILYSSWDFQQALSAITFLQEECKYDDKYSSLELRRLRCFESTAIVSFSRPFEASRGKSTLGLRELDIKLNTNQRKIKNRLVYLRRKIVAHSDEEEMHFRVSTFSIAEEGVNFTNFEYDEKLNLTEQEVCEFESLLRFIIKAIHKWLFQLAQNQPELLNKYKRPVG